MEPYVLLPLSNRSGIVDGSQFHTLRRERWTVTLKLPSLEASGSVSVQLQAAPVADEDSFEDRHDFGTLSSEGTTIVRSWERDGVVADFSWSPEDIWMRAVVSAQTGDYVLECQAEGRFIDLENEAEEELLSEMLRKSITTRGRFVDEAERQVLKDLQRGSETTQGVLMVNTDDVEADSVIREAIVDQAAWLQQRQLFLNSGKAEDRREGLKMRGLAPEVEETLSNIVLMNSRVWFGR